VRLFITEEAALAEYKHWHKNGNEVYFGKLQDVAPTVTAQEKAAWAQCCKAAGRLADLVVAMYHHNDPQARKTWPTATWAEMIASETGVKIPSED